MGDSWIAAWHRMAPYLNALSHGVPQVHQRPLLKPPIALKQLPQVGGYWHPAEAQRCPLDGAFFWEGSIDTGSAYCSAFILTFHFRILWQRAPEDPRTGNPISVSVESPQDGAVPDGEFNGTPPSFVVPLPPS